MVQMRLHVQQLEETQRQALEADNQRLRGQLEDVAVTGGEHLQAMRTHTLRSENVALKQQLEDLRAQASTTHEGMGEDWPGPPPHSHDCPVSLLAVLP
jgi:hypothetical protein